MLTKEEARAELKRLLKPGDTIYCVLRHVSDSGMQRRIDFFVIKKNEPLYLTAYMGYLLDYRMHKDRGLVVRGCGMDMGFFVVYNLASELFSRSKKPGYSLTSRWL